jgi:subtilase family serine protease
MRTFLAVGVALVTSAFAAVPAQATIPPVAAEHAAVRVCAAAPAGFASCGALLVTRPTRNPSPAASPAGYGPGDLRSAYNLPAAPPTGAAPTVAVVDAYDDPTAASDLGVYRRQFGLPALNAAGGPTFTKVNQSGGTSYPRKDAGWAAEISLDLDMVSAICPSCNILLVEASSASFANLGAAVNYAASVPGVVAISNSYGGSDSSQLSAYKHPGIAVTASTGDSGYGVQSPASFDSVVAVGGTSLQRSSSSRGWTETAWSGAGSGCSTKNPQPSWQTSVTQCSGKANADVSAVADPNTGVAVYDSTAYMGSVGWQVYGGTSVSSPIIASVFALAGNTGVAFSGSTPYPASRLWAATSGLNDATSGSNGTCTTSVWCTAGTGWDGPTGLGTPNGVGAF